MVSRNRLGGLDRLNHLATIWSGRYGGSRRFEYVLRYDEILYQVHNAIAVKGRISEVAETLTDGRRNILFRPAGPVPAC